MDVEVRGDPVSGLVRLSWVDTPPGRRGGSRVLDGPELDLVIDALHQIRVGLTDRFGSDAGQVSIDLGPFLDAVLKRTPSRP